MTQLLVVGTAILAVGPFTMTPDEIRAPDVIFPVHTVEGWQMVSAELPPDFTPLAYEWVKGGLAAREQPAPPIEVPARVPMLNAQLVLIEMDWWEPLQAYIGAMPAKEQLLARTYMAQALTMARDHELVLAIPAALGKTEAEVDQLFIMAGALDV